MGYEFIVDYYELSSHNSALIYEDSARRAQSDPSQIWIH